MWNLRYISIRTEQDENIWFENHFQAEEKNQTIQEVQTWEFSSIQASSMIQFELQMFPVGKSKTTDWELVLEISFRCEQGMVALAALDRTLQSK